MTGYEIRLTVAVLESYALAGLPSASAATAPDPTGVTGSARPPLVPAPGEVDYEGTLVAMLRAGTRLAALGMRLGMWIIVLSPLWHLRRFRSFRSLTPAERADLLTSLGRHRFWPVRELVFLLKINASLALFNVPSIRARSGFDAVTGADAGAPTATASRLGVVS